MAQKRQSYDPGTWGHYTNDLNGKIMEGFQIDRPQIDDICGEYNIVFAASFTPHNEDNKETPFRWHVRQKVSGSLLIIRHPLTVSGTFPMAYCAKVVLFTDQSSGPIYQYLRNGYNAYGFGTGIAGEPNNGCSNCLPVKCLGLSGRGHLYVVSQRKAFPMVQQREKTGSCSRNLKEEDDEDEEKEGGGDGAPSISAGTDANDDSKYAEHIYNTRHYSFLCRELGFSCVVSTLISQYIGNDILPKPQDYPPYFYAEPGDIWMDTKLSSSNTRRTYILARRLNDNETHVQSQLIANMSQPARFAYMIVRPSDVAPLVHWMQARPGLEPPAVLTRIVEILHSVNDRNLTTFGRTVNATRRHNPHPLVVATPRNDEQQEGVVTRSRARRHREETERVLRPRRKKICYRT